MVVRKLVSAACLIVMLAALGFAQGASTGDLHITVRDSEGRPGDQRHASAARDETKGLERATSENSDGQYQHSAAASGAVYGHAWKAPGFGKADRDRTLPSPWDRWRKFPSVWRWRERQEVINVSSAAELVETQRTSSTDTIDQRRIDNLPINGRNYINFALTDSQAGCAITRPALERLRPPG